MPIFLFLAEVLASSSSAFTLYRCGLQNESFSGIADLVARRVRMKPVHLRRGPAASNRKVQWLCSRCRRLSFTTTSRRGRAGPSQPLYISRQQAYEPRLTTPYTAKRWLASVVTEPQPAIEPPPYKDGRSAPDERNRSDNIRDRLRAWGRQNELKKETERPAEVPAAGPVLQLPNSLFIDDSVHRLDQSSAEDLAPEDEMLDFGDEFAEPVRSTLERGSLVEILAPGYRQQLAVFLGYNGLQEAYLLQCGHYSIFSSSLTKSPVLQGFATPSEVAAVRRHLPKKPLVRSDGVLGMDQPFHFSAVLPPKAAGPLVGRVRDFDQEVLRLRRQHIALLDGIHERYAHETRWVGRLFDDMVLDYTHTDPEFATMAGRMALFRGCMQDPGNIIFNCISRTALAWKLIFTPKSYAGITQQVVAWARDYQDIAAQAALGKDVQSLVRANPIDSFTRKARSIIIKSRKIRSPTSIGFLGPCRQRPDDPSKQVEVVDSGVVFSETDKTILDFLWSHCVQAENAGRKMAIVSLILRAIGAYPEMSLRRKIGMLLLQELGVLPPWRPSDDESSVVLSLPGRKGGHEAADLLQETNTLADELGLTTNKVPFPDTVADLRKDLGQMEVFVVDPTATRVHDDGFSLEPCADHPECWWIHIHVAHPAAFIPSDSAFLKLAKVLGVTHYDTNNHQSMLPPSIGENLGLKSGASTLTFSTLIDQAGNVLKREVAPTKVHNVMHLSQNAFEGYLKDSEEDSGSILIVGSAMKSSESVDATDQAAMEEVLRHAEKFRKLKWLLEQRNKARVQESPQIATFTLHRPDLTTYTNFNDPFDPDRLSRSLQYVGDPTVLVKEHRAVDRTPLSELWRFKHVIAWLMDLLAETGGKWLSDRQIPVVYSNTSTAPAFPISKLNTLKREERRLLPTAYVSTEPGFNIVSHMRAKTSLGSPLRKYVDLAAQYNITEYLRAEATGKIQPGSAGAEVEFPFTKEQLESYYNTYGWTLRTKARMVSIYQRRLCCYALFRAFHFKEAILPDIWDVTFQQAEPWDLKNARPLGFLHPFRLAVSLVPSEERYEARAPRTWSLPCKLEIVDAADCVIYAKAVGEATPEPRYQSLTLLSEEGWEMEKQRAKEKEGGEWEVVETEDRFLQLRRKGDEAVAKAESKAAAAAGEE